MIPTPPMQAYLPSKKNTGASLQVHSQPAANVGPESAMAAQGSRQSSAGSPARTPFVTGVHSIPFLHHSRRHAARRRDDRYRRDLLPSWYGADDAEQGDGEPLAPYVG